MLGFCVRFSGFRGAVFTNRCCRLLRMALARAICEYYNVIGYPALFSTFFFTDRRASGLPSGLSHLLSHLRYFTAASPMLGARVSPPAATPCSRSSCLFGGGLLGGWGGRCARFSDVHLNCEASQRSVFTAALSAPFFHLRVLREVFASFGFAFKLRSTSAISFHSRSICASCLCLFFSSHPVHLRLLL